MSFFNWNPENSNQVISPWIGVFFVLFLITTGATLRFGHMMSNEERVQNDIESGFGIGKASVGTSSVAKIDSKPEQGSTHMGQVIDKLG
jgi:hypothetical protein